MMQNLVCKYHSDIYAYFIKIKKQLVPNIALVLVLIYVALEEVTCGVEVKEQRRVGLGKANRTAVGHDGFCGPTPSQPVCCIGNWSNTCRRTEIQSSFPFLWSGPVLDYL